MSEPALFSVSSVFFSSVSGSSSASDFAALDMTNAAANEITAANKNGSIADKTLYTNRLEGAAEV